MISYKIYEKFDEKFFNDIEFNNNEFIFNLFQLINWTKVSIELSNNLFELKIVTIYENKKIIFIAPLCIKNIDGCKQLSWLSSEVIDYNNGIFSKDYLNYKKNFRNLE